MWAKGPNTVNILHDYFLPWQERVRLSLANQPADAPLSSSITTPTSSRFLPWIILSPNHGGAFELSYYHQTMLISFDYLCTKQAPIRPHLIIVLSLPSTSRVTWSIFSIQSTHQYLSSAYPHTKDKCTRQVSPVHEIGHIFPLSSVPTYIAVQCIAYHGIRVVIKVELNAIGMNKNRMICWTEF